MIAKISVISKNKQIGTIEFTVDNVDEATGTVTLIDLPGAIKHDLIVELSTNKSKNRLIGGTMPDRIGKYADGLWAILMMLSKKHDFDFDASQLPYPKLPSGAVS